MKPWLKWKSDGAALLLILLLLLSHLPFITADPDKDISFSRGPFTDEGLNTIQVRNLINQGYLSFTECDNLLKTPVFGAVIGVPMFLLGSSLGVSRITVLMLLMAALVLTIRKNPYRNFLFLFIPIVLYKYQVFQFSHFSLAEIPASASILMGIIYLSKAYLPFRREKQTIIDALLAASFVSLAYFFKIQFIYIVPLLSLIALERLISNKQLPKRQLHVNGMVLTAVTIFFLLLYLLAWYLPLKGPYDFMMAHQSGTFELSSRSFELVRFNVEYFLFSPDNALYTSVFILCSILGIILLFRRTSNQYPVLFKAAFLWNLLEMHKLTMIYWPTRYQLSYFFSMGLLITIVLYELFRTNVFRSGKVPPLLKQAMLVSMVALILFINIADYLGALSRREYTIREANEYLAINSGQEDVVLGAWAPSLTWESKSRALPVWGGFLNDSDPVNRFHPRAVISEPDQQDSEQAYMKQGIDLKQVSDSLRSFDIGRWKVNVYWIRN